MSAYNKFTIIPYSPPLQVIDKTLERLYPLPPLILDPEAAKVQMDSLLSRLLDDMMAPISGKGITLNLKIK